VKKAYNDRASDCVDEKEPAPASSPMRAPNVVSVIDFQFDSLRCGTLVKVPRMVDEHTREYMLDISIKSITSEKVIDHVRKSLPNAKNQ